MEGGPEIVNGKFWCYNNKLTNLKGCPKVIGSDFWCFNNKLTSLKYSPKRIDGFFKCYKNKLTSLEGAPKKINGIFDFSNNPVLDKLSEEEVFDMIIKEGIEADSYIFGSGDGKKYYRNKEIDNRKNILLKKKKLGAFA